MPKSNDAPEVISKKQYEKELKRLQTELVELQEWIVHAGLRVAVLFEGRDTAGKGGVIKRIARAHQPAGGAHGRARHADRARAAPSGTSSATSPICRRRGRWSCSTAAGTTAPASSG